MQSEQELVMERQSKQSVANTAATSAVKTILLQILDDDSCNQRIETGLALARAHSAHLSCLHVTAIEAYVASGSFGGVFVMSEIINALDERDVELRAKVEKRLQRDDVSWDYEQATGSVASLLISRGALADLVVVAREPLHDDFVGPTVGFLGDLLHRSRTPLFIPGSDGGMLDPTGPALIAWNGSFEAANAVRASLGLLKLSREVRVLQVSERKEDQQTFPGTKLVEYLSRQGIHAEQVSQPQVAVSLAEELVADASIYGAAYVVMGGYSHSRAGEFLFGGVTRDLLKHCPIALVIAH